ncbi:hypothetical protein AB1935_005480 [Pseudomonas aeruginosa]
MSLSLMRFMVKADAKLGFVPYDTLLNKKLEVSYRSIEAAFRRCDSLNQVSAGGTARAQQAQPSVDGKAPATRLLNVYNRIHELYSRICTSVDGLSVFRAHRSEYDGLLNEYVQLAAAQVVNRANPSPYWGHDRFTVSGEGFSMVCSANSGDVLEVSIQGIVKDAAAETLRSIERVDIRELAEWFHSVSYRNFELAGRTLDIRAVGYWPRGGGDRVSPDEDFREDALQRQVGRPALRM